MTKKIFAIYDEKAEAYLQPFFLDTMPLAIRMIGDLLQQPEHNFAKHPSDYTLFLIGEFDESTSKIESFKTCVANFVELTNYPLAPEE